MNEIDRMHESSHGKSNTVTIRVISEEIEQTKQRITNMQ